MATLATQTQSHLRVEEKRIKRDAYKQRKVFASGSHPRKAASYPASWTSKWKLHRRKVSTKSNNPKEEIVSGPVIYGRKPPPRAAQEADAEPEIILPKTIYIGPELMTVNHFHSNYASHSSAMIFKRLPAYYTTNLSDSSHTRHATHAVALASAARSLRQPGLMLEARRYYCRAIATLNRALQDPVGVRDDSNLVTLFLFGMFEVINGKRGPKTIDLEQNVFPHGAGGLELFRFRAEQGLTNEVDKSCFMFFCHAALMEMFIQREHLTPLWSVLEDMETPWCKGPILEPLIRRVVDFKRAFDFKTQVQSNTSKLDEGPQEDLIALIQSSIKLSNDLEAAVTLLSFLGTSTCFDQQQKVFNGLFSLSCEASVAIARSHYRCLRVYVLERIIELRSILKNDGWKVGPDLGPMPTWSDGVSVVDDVLEDIRVVFGLEGKQAPDEGFAYRTMTMFWPMVLVRTSYFAGPRNGKWVAEQMLKLATESGFGLGVEAAGL